jgi:ferritin-like metal-binding protein YciE
MNIRILDDLILHELQQLHVAEYLFLGALPTLMKEDRSATQSILQAQTRIQRLEQIFSAGARLMCRAMEGIIADATDTLGNVKVPNARDCVKESSTKSRSKTSTRTGSQSPTRADNVLPPSPQ